MPKKKSDKPPKIHKDLSGFAIRINAFGEIETTLNVESLNNFLNENVDDKKLRGQKQDEEETNTPEQP